MKRKLLLLTTVATLFITNQAAAQQDPMYTQYMFNMLGVNPAYAGSRNVLSITGLYRNQWAGIAGAPETMTASVDFPVANKRIGLGLMVVNDKIGKSNNLSLYSNYSYRLRLGAGVLSLGLSAGVNNYRGDFADVITGSLYNTGIQDPAFYNINKMLPNFGAGAYYYTDNFFFGVSAPKILQHDLSKTTGLNLSNASDVARQYRHYFLTTGFVIAFSDAVKLKPSILVKAVEGAPIQLDINANLWFGGKFGIGASYRSGDSVDGLLEFQLTPQFRLGYAYDFTLTELGKYTTGSHEVLLRYETGYTKGNIISPRYF